MDVSGWLIFAAAILVGSYVQAVAGFAMGMIVMAIGGAAGLVGLPELAAVVSLTTMVNIMIALKGHTRLIHWPVYRWMILGQIPAMIAGVWLITALDREARWLLELLLGGFILLGSFTMMIKPVAWQKASSPPVCVLAGIGGGLIGGLFAASGPVIGWFAYRQPLALPVIRATLLGFFALATVSRTVIVGIQGGLTHQVLLLAGVALPLVVFGTWLGRVARPRVSDTVFKRLVFGMLVLMGLYIVTSASLA